MSFQSEEFREQLEMEAFASGHSKTEYVNRILLRLFLIPNALTDGDRLEEIEAYFSLVNDELMPKVCELAKKNRRDPVQQILCLVEVALKGPA